MAQMELKTLFKREGTADSIHNEAVRQICRFKNGGSLKRNKNSNPSPPPLEATIALPPSLFVFSLSKVRFAS
jgi:hypothetical protein